MGHPHILILISIIAYGVNSQVNFIMKCVSFSLSFGGARTRARDAYVPVNGAWETEHAAQYDLGPSVTSQQVYNRSRDARKGQSPSAPRWRRSDSHAIAIFVKNK
ncbi:hypothetical protein Tco_0321670 [Tanacetum coccineum]